MSEHILPRKTYFFIWALLIALTFGTWGIALIDLGRWNIVVALLIAFTKATVVALFFMHLKYSSRRTQLALGAGLVWLIILLFLTLADYRTRDLPTVGNPPVPVLPQVGPQG